MANEQPPLTQQRALERFQQDLPQLWVKRPGQWVAHHGDQRLGFATQKHELYQRCLKGGLQRDEFVVFRIEDQQTEMDLGPVVLD